ncbi:MAG: S1C family serine protease [Bacilli bacterium]|jgi:serine protease|nr:trypsin-like peptidase domain-containing protein [Staphylococcus sp.]
MVKRNFKMCFVALIISAVVFLTSCTGINFTTSKKETIDVENKITNTVVNYENITIADLENCIVNTTKMVENAVIGVTLKANYNTTIMGKPISSEDTESIGSGVIYKRVENKDNDSNITGYTYYAVTNRHVITGNNVNYEYKIYAYLGYEDLEIEAEIVGYDTKVDMAVIKFEHSTLIQPVEFANSDEVEKGQFVIAIGNPDGYDYYGSATLGIVSGELRYISDDTDGDNVNDFNATYIQHDASINPGNSGGGLFTIDGKLIGINTLKIVDDEIDNMGFAIPSNIIQSLIENYIEKEIEITRPRLGITGSNVRELTNAVIAANGLLEIPDIYGITKPYGLYVVSITPGGSLSESGVQKDDIILTFDGEKLTSMNILSAKLNSLTEYFIGSEVQISYYSRSQNKIITETIILK